jgi:hypothetical protein
MKLHNDEQNIINNSINEEATFFTSPANFKWLNRLKSGGAQFGNC